MWASNAPTILVHGCAAVKNAKGFGQVVYRGGCAD